MVTTQQPPDGLRLTSIGTEPNFDDIGALCGLGALCWGLREESPSIAVLRRHLDVSSLWLTGWLGKPDTLRGAGFEISHQRLQKRCPSCFRSGPRLRRINSQCTIYPAIWALHCQAKQTTLEVGLSYRQACGWG